MRPSRLLYVDFKKGFERNIEYSNFHRDNLGLWFKFTWEHMKYVIPIGFIVPVFAQKTFFWSKVIIE